MHCKLPRAKCVQDQGTIFDFRRSQCPVQPVTIGTDTVEIVNEYKYLGTIIDNQLNWSSNIRQLYSKCQQRLYFLRKLNEFHIDHTIMHNYVVYVCNPEYFRLLYTGILWQCEQQGYPQGPQNYQTSTEVNSVPMSVHIGNL